MELATPAKEERAHHLGGHQSEIGGVRQADEQPQVAAVAGSRCFGVALQIFGVSAELFDERGDKHKNYGVLP